MAEIFGEAERPRELDRYVNLDVLRDGAFDDITALAARFFRVPVAIVSLVHGDRVWLKSAHGLNGIFQGGADLGLWASAMMADAACAGTGSESDRTSPPVANDNDCRFYAVAPLRSLHGHRLGALCIADIVARKFTREDEQMLARFGRLAMLQLEHRLLSRTMADLVNTGSRELSLLSHAAPLDVRTGVMDRSAIQSLHHRLCERSTDEPAIATLLFDLDHFQTVNDIYGQAGGDAVLAEVASRIQAAVRPGDHVGRFGGAEFLVVLVDCDGRSAMNIAERVRQMVAVPIRYRDYDICITISAGAYVAHGKTDAEAALKAADDALHQAQREGRNRVVFSRPPIGAVIANA